MENSENKKLVDAVIGVSSAYARSQGWKQLEQFKWSHPFMGGAIVYLSGPMSGHSNHNREAFWLAEMGLNLVGVATLSPAHQQDGLSYEQYMRNDFQSVLAANTVFALRGWKNSRGAVAEVTMARSLGYAIHEEI